MDSENNFEKGEKVNFCSHWNLNFRKDVLVSGAWFKEMGGEGTSLCKHDDLVSGLEPGGIKVI